MLVLWKMLSVLGHSWVVEAVCVLGILLLSLWFSWLSVRVMAARSWVFAGEIWVVLVREGLGILGCLGWWKLGCSMGGNLGILAIVLLPLGLLLVVCEGQGLLEVLVLVMGTGWR